MIYIPAVFNIFAIYLSRVPKLILTVKCELLQYRKHNPSHKRTVFKELLAEKKEKKKRFIATTKETTVRFAYHQSDGLGRESM